MCYNRLMIAETAEEKSTSKMMVESERIVERMLAIDRRVADKIRAGNAKLENTEADGAEPATSAVCPHCGSDLAECGPNFWCEKCGELMSMDEVEWPEE